ncbi:MAG: universal stress protein [Bacteroidales bacterium]
MLKPRILVPVNFAPGCEETLSQAGLLAQQAGAILSCLHVMETKNVLSRALALGDQNKKQRREAEVALASFVHKVFDGIDSIPFELIVSEGDFVETVVQKVEELDVLFLVVSGKSTPDHPSCIRKSDHFRLLAQARVPVLSLGELRLTKLQHVLVPVDMGKGLRRQLSALIDLAGSFELSLTLCSVIRPSSIRYEEACRKRLTAITVHLRNLNFSCRTKLLVTHRDVASEVLGRTDQFDTDLLLVQTSTSGDRSKIGQVTRDILQKSPMPVMTVGPLCHVDAQFNLPGVGRIFEPVKDTFPNEQ